MKKNYRITIEPLSEDAIANGQTEIYECASFLLGALLDKDEENIYGISQIAGSGTGYAARVLARGLPRELVADFISQMLEIDLDAAQEEEGFIL